MPRSAAVALVLASLLAAAACRDKVDQALGPFGVADMALDVDATGEAFVPTLDGPLRVLSATPFGGTVSVVDRQPVTVTFSQPMVPLGDPPAPDPSLLTVRQGRRAVEGTLAWDGSQTLVFTPNDPLSPATTFSARLAAGAASLDGETLDEPFEWTFETPRPRLARSVPRRGEAHAAPGSGIRLFYDQAVQGNRAGSVVEVTADGARVDARVEAGGDSTVVVRPAGGLRRGTAYVVRVMPGLPAAAGPLGSADTASVRFRTYGDLALESVGQAEDPYAEPEPGTALDPSRGVRVTFSNPVTFEAARRAVSLSPAAALPAGVEAGDGRVSTEHTLPFQLAPETSYTLAVRGLGDTFGQRLAEATATFRTGATAPDLSVPEGILVIEADGRRSLPVRATNVASVQAGIQRLGPDEIVPALRAHDQRHYYGELADGEAEPSPIAAPRTFQVPLERNTPGTVFLPIERALTGQTGVVAVRVVRKMTADYTVDARSVAQITNLGVTGKFSPHGQLVLVTRLDSARPVAGATVTLRDADNRVRWTGKTDRSGRAQAPGWDEMGVEKASAWQPPPLFAIVQAGGDLAFTSSLYDDGTEAYRFDVDTDWSPEPVTTAGSVFSDRGLYRAGETVHVKGILRQRADRDWRPVRDSARVVIRSPRDEVVVDRAVLPSDWGTFDVDWDAPAAAAQGLYEVRIASTTDTTATDGWSPSAWASGTFRVDAFRRATFVVDAESAAPAYVAGDFFEGTITGRYLFGAGMGGQPVSFALRQEAGSFAPPGFEAFRFGPLGVDPPTETLAQAETTLGPDGSVRRRMRLPGNENGLPTQLVWSATVTDPARQEQAGRQTLTLHPARFYVGLRPQTTYLDLSDRDEMEVDVVTVDPGGAPVGDRTVRVQLIRQQWNSVREVGADGRLRWRSELAEEPLGVQTVSPGAGRMARVSFPVEAGGQYVVRATATDVRGNAVRTDAMFYAAGDGYVAWERSDDDRIGLVPEKSRYAPGETARVLVQSPFESATALVTVEREGVLSSRVVTLEGSAPQVEVELGEEHLPNAFVSVVLLHGRTARPQAGADAGAPQFRMGVVNLPVDAGARRLTVEVEPQNKEVRPGETMTVDLRLTDARGRGVAGEIAFSAADAGVLNLIDYTLPDPFDAFYGPRGLAVTTSVTLAELVRQRSYGQKEEDLGGGGGEHADRLRRDFRPSAHWAPALRTDGRGRARVTFKMPESLTTFRLMATALTPEHAFGSGSTDVVVTQPLVLQPALPRFARPGDTFQAGVLVSNRTDQAGTAVVRAQGTGVGQTGETEKRVQLAAGQTREVRFGWTAGAPGKTAPEVQFTAQMGGERDAFVTPLKVALPTTRTTTATFASTDGGAREALQLPADALVGLGGLRVTVASTALVGLDGASRYLFDYPYGCLEQRTSAVRPLLLGRDLLDAYDLAALDGNRDAAVRKWLGDLDGFWTGNGFTMWTGGTEPNVYTSAYTVLALAEAQAAGYRVPTGLTQKAVSWLEQSVRNPSDKPTYYSPGVWADTRAMMLFALARHGRTNASETLRLAADPDLSDEGAATILRTVALDPGGPLGRLRQPLTDRLRQKVRVEATSATLASPDAEAWSWIFASDVRATASALTALVEAAPTSDTRQLGQRMVRYLMGQQTGGHWASTQDNALVIDAFRAFAQAFEKATPAFTAEVRVAGQQLLQQSFQGRSLAVAEAERPLSGLGRGQNVPVSIAKRGPGTAYYLLTLDTYSTAPQAARSNGLSVARTVQPVDDRGEPEGSALGASATLRAGQMVRVTVRLQSPAARSYVVVDDALPAGLEALNAAFDTTPDAARQQGQDRWWGSFNHTEVQDDRVLLFADRLLPGTHTYTYLAWATTPGTFVHPPAQAHAMYSPEVSGQTATGRLVVRSS